MTSERLMPQETFLDALATVGSTAPPGSPVSIDQVAQVAGLERAEATRIALALIGDGLVDGVPLTGDDETKSINGLGLTGAGRRELSRQRGLRVLLAVDRGMAGDPDGAVPAGAIGVEMGWTPVDASRIAYTLVDDGLLEEVGMGSDLVRTTPAGRAYLDSVAAGFKEEGSMAGVSINKAGIARMMREIQREFDKHPIKFAVEADGTPQPAHTTIYNGPVIHGDATGAQLAWGNQAVSQARHDEVEQIAPGYEALAQAIVSTLQQLPAAGLGREDQSDAETAAREALAALTQPKPDHGVIRRTIAALKGHLAQVAAGLVTGAQQGAQEWAKTALLTPMWTDGQGVELVVTG